MKKSINHIFEAAEIGGFQIKELACNKSGVKVWLEKNYLFFEVYYDISRNVEISHYLTVMEDKYIRSIGITLNQY